MATVNAVGNGLSGASGSGSFAGNTSPVFVTPTLGTPVSGTLTTCTGLPISTGVSGLGTGVAAALAINTGSAGSPVTLNGALGTPTSGTLTNCTSLPISGISALGTGVATALAANVTGSGGIALATSPSFTTPVLGAGSATSLSFSSTTGIIGTTTNDNAPSGSVGYYTSSLITVGSAVSLTTATPANITSISLPAGDFDVWGNVAFLPSGTTTIVFLCGWISSTSASQPDSSLSAQLTYDPTAMPSNVIGFTVPSFRFSLSSPTTIYLSVTTVFGVSTLSACGGIYARERR